MNIQSEPLTNPCMICGGKGDVLVVDTPDGIMFFLDTYLNRKRWEARPCEFLTCGQCRGTGEVPAVEVKR